MANVVKRGKNSYRVSISGGFDSQGNRIQFRKTIKIDESFGPAESKAHQAELEKQVALFVADVDRGTTTNLPNLKLKEFVDDVWFPLHVQRKNLAPKTVWRYNQLLSRITFSLGHIRLKNLKPKHIMEFLANLKEENIRITKKEERKKIPLSDQTVLHHYRLLHAILEKAKDWQYIVINPVTAVESPQVKKTRKKVFTEEQINKIKTALGKRSVRDELLVLLTIATGARLGEVLGLTWDMLDLKTGALKIEQSYQYTPETGRIDKPPKNESSVREITLPKAVLGIAKKWQGEQTEKYEFMKWTNDGNAIFTTYLGTRLAPNTVSTWFPKWVESLGLPRITFHGLRHTAASLLISYGATAAEVARLLGHSTIGTTMNIYVHDFDDASKNMAAKMQSILFEKKKKRQPKKPEKVQK